MVHSVSQFYPALLALAGDRGTAAGLVAGTTGWPCARWGRRRRRSGPSRFNDQLVWGWVAAIALVLVPVPEPWRVVGRQPAPGAGRAVRRAGPGGGLRPGRRRGRARRRGPRVDRGVPVAVRRRRAHTPRARRHLARFPASARDAGHRRVRPMIEVILREDVKSLGKAGELVRVKPGYARNYLLPAGPGLRGHRGQQEAHRRGNPRPRRPEPGRAGRGRARRPPSWARSR